MKNQQQKEFENDWIYSLILLAAFVMVSVSCEEAKADEDLYLYDSAYVRVGVGYKLEEKTLYNWDKYYEDYSRSNVPEAARIELGFRRGNLIYGINHRSQYSQGVPFNSKVGDSYNVTEIFIDYILEF